MLSAEELQSSGEYIADLKIRASLLIAKLEEGDFYAASDVIQRLNETRDKSLYQEVGKLTRGLHDAIVNFHIDAGIEALKINGEDSQIQDATDRLDYVIAATQKAANKTLDLVEDGIPIAAKFSLEAEGLKREWKRLAKRELDAGEFRQLYKRIDDFLELSVSSASRLKNDFNSILLAQDYQDLTGQVIQRVIRLVHDVEDSLVNLVRLAGEVEEFTGVINSVEEISKARKCYSNIHEKPVANLVPEGPVMHAEQRTDVCHGQDEVDDLLSSLGF